MGPGSGGAGPIRPAGDVLGNETVPRYDPCFVSTRMKTLGLAAAITAVAVAIPTGVQAYAEPELRTPKV